jgi:CheY-like chemotaxis protein
MRLELAVDGHESITILVVEDEVLLRDMMVEHLVAAGFRVLEASSAEAALAMAGNGHQIDLVFTDIRLSGKLSGWDVGEGFRAAAPDMPIIYASGLILEPKRDVSGSEFFSKPYEPDDIVAACRRLTGMVSG